MTGKWIPDFSREQVIRWLEERRDNCTRLASLMPAPDRDGWLEDGAYFEAAVRMLANATKDQTPTQGELK